MAPYTSAVQNFLTKQKSENKLRTINRFRLVEFSVSLENKHVLDQLFDSAPNMIEIVDT